MPYLEKHSEFWRKLICFVKMDGIHYPLHKLHKHIPMVYHYKKKILSHLWRVVHTNAHKKVQWKYISKQKICLIILKITNFKPI